MSKKTLYIIIVIIVLLGIGVWLWMQAPVTQAPSAGQVPQASDTTASINEDLQNITIEDPDFQSIDTDVNSL